MVKRNSESADKLFGKPAWKTRSARKRTEKRLDVHEAVIVTILQHVMHMIDLPVTPRLRCSACPPWRRKLSEYPALNSRPLLTSYFSLIT